MSPTRLAYGIGAAILVAGALVATGLAFVRGQSPSPAAAQPPVSITADQARAVALGAVPGTVLELDLDDAEIGRIAYQVSIEPQSGDPIREVVVDPSTGAVLSNEFDDDFPSVPAWLR